LLAERGSEVRLIQPRPEDLLPLHLLMFLIARNTV